MRRGKRGNHHQIRSETDSQRGKRSSSEELVEEASITEILLEGRATEEISAYVKDHAIDLTVIGTHGRKGLDRLFIGSLTDKIIRTTTVPVIVVHWM
jgi:nucleotide-binding universal stress UspA family protein